MTLVDAGVLLDVLTDDPLWADWSIRQLSKASAGGVIGVNPVICVELFARIGRMVELEWVLEECEVAVTKIPPLAVHMAAEMVRRDLLGAVEPASTPEDLLVGSHAVVSGIPLLTRNVGRYRLFRSLRLICPQEEGRPSLRS